MKKNNKIIYIFILGLLFIVINDNVNNQINYKISLNRIINLESNKTIKLENDLKDENITFNSLLNKRFIKENLILKKYNITYKKILAKNNLKYLE